MSDIRQQLRDAINEASDRIHNSQDWEDEYYGKPTVMDELVEKIVTIAQVDLQETEQMWDADVKLLNRIICERDDARLCARVLWDYIESHYRPRLMMRKWEERWPFLIEDEPLHTTGVDEGTYPTAEDK